MIMGVGKGNSRAGTWPSARRGRVDRSTPKRHPRSLSPMLACYFCGGRVLPLGGEVVRGRGRQIAAYRCEAEGVRWDVGENLTIYTHSPSAAPRVPRDPESGKFVSKEAPA